MSNDTTITIVGNLTAEEEVVVTERGARLLSPRFPERIAVLG